MREYDEPHSFDDNKPKRKHSNDPTTWGQAWQAIGLMTVILVLLGGASSFLQDMLLGDKLQRYLEIVTTGSYSANPFAGLANIYDSPLAMAIGVIVWLLVWIAGLFIVYGLSHFFATRLSGVGTMRGLIVRSNTWMIVSYLLLVIGSFVSNYMLVNNIVDYAARIDFSASQETLLAFQNYMFTQLQITSAISLAVWVIWGIGMSNIIGKYYQFGQGKGCLSVVFLNLSLLTMYCALSMFIGFVLFSALT